MSYIQYFEISGNTVAMLDSGMTLQVINLQATNMIVSGNTVNTNDFITTGGTQNISGVKNFIGGLTVTGLTINGDLYNKANFLSANTSFYTQTQANNNFLSANTSFYTQTQANANFLSANTAYVHTGTTQTISGSKTFTNTINITNPAFITGLTTLYNGLSVTGNTVIKGSLNVMTSFSGSTPNQDGQYLVYDKNLSGYTNKFNGYDIIYVNNAMSPYNVTGISVHLIVDTSAGDVIINLANYNVNLLGGSTVVAKITGDPNYIQINCPSGYTFLDKETSQYINKFNEHLQFTMVGPYMGVAYKETSDNRTNRNILTVSPNPFTRKDFNTIKEAIDFFNNRNDGDCVIQLDAADHIINSAITVNSIYNLIIQGTSYDQCNIISTIQLTGQPMFISNTNINFEKLSLYGYAYGMGYSGYGFRNGEDGVRINGDGLYCQFQDVGIYGFYNNIRISGNSEIWVFNSTLESAANAGIYDYMGDVTISETGFANNKNSLYLYSGSSNKVSVENAIFQTNTAQTAINYFGNQFNYSIFYIQGNAFYGSGTTLSGFNFAIARDSDIRVRTNPGIQDYTALAFVVFSNNATTTSTNTTAVKALGSNVTGTTFGIKFDVTTNNRAVYLSSVASPIKIMVTGDIIDASNNRTLIVSINKNGNAANVLQEVEVRCTTGSQPYPFSINAIDISANKNDYYEIFIRDSATGGGNMTLRDLQFILEQ